MINEALRRLKERLDSIILGKPDVTKMALVTLIAKGHLLIEDVPKASPFRIRVFTRFL